MASSAASQGAGMAAALVVNEKKEKSTFVEIGISENGIFDKKIYRFFAFKKSI